MTVTAQTIQDALENDGYYFIPKGVHNISDRIKLIGANDVFLEGHPRSVLNWVGSATGTIFDIASEGVPNFSQIYMRNVTAVSTVNGANVCKAYWQTPHNITFENCNFTATGAYCIDFDEMNYTVPPYFINMRTNGGGACRLRARRGGEGYWFTSLMMIEGWIHNGSHRVGPAFDFRGCKGLLARNLFDRGSVALLPALRGYYTGPLSCRLNSPGFFTEFHNFIAEYDDDFTNSSGCFLHEFRDDSGYSTGQHANIKISNMTMHNDSIDAGVKHVRFFGGHGGTSEHAMVIDLYNCKSLNAENLLVGGRCWVTANRTWYEPGEESKFAAAQTFFNEMGEASFNDPIMTYTGGFPTNTTGLDGTYTTGEDRYQNWMEISPDFEDILENL